MVELPVGIVLAMGAGALWFAGLRLFLRSSLSPARKLGWTTLLVMAGISIGVLLSFGQLGIRFVVLILILPALGLADVALFRSGRGLSFWTRACGFEVCSVFGVAFAVRLDLQQRHRELPADGCAVAPTNPMVTRGFLPPPGAVPNRACCR